MTPASAARERQGEVDALITPDTSSWSRSEMEDIPALVKEGYRAARKVLDRIQESGIGRGP